MAKIQLILRGTLPDISVQAFIRFIENSFKILTDLDRAVSTERRGTLQWNLSDLRPGSASVEYVSKVVRGDEDFGPTVTRAYLNGLSGLLEQPRTPALFTDADVRLVRNYVRDFGRDGVTSATVALPDKAAAVDVSPTMEPNLAALIGVHHKSLGAVEGRLELLSLHRPYRKFVLYNTLTNKGVRCTLPSELEETVIGAINRRVIATGVVSYNAVGEPLSVNVERLRVLRSTPELPNARYFLGLIPDLSDGFSTEEHLRRINGDR